MNVIPLCIPVLEMLKVIHALFFFSVVLISHMLHFLLFGTSTIHKKLLPQIYEDVQYILRR